LTRILAEPAHHAALGTTRPTTCGKCAPPFGIRTRASGAAAQPVERWWVTPLVTLFENFSGYVDFFLLQDLVSEHCSAVRVFPAFDDFKTPSVPRDIDTYPEYRRLSIEFIEARNRRIQQQPPGCGGVER
jgi:hypothetical protein